MGTYSSSKEQIPLLPLLLVNFIGTLGFSIVLPFLVFLVTRFGGNAIIYGVIGATYPAFQLIGAPILGKWSDLYGRRKILFLSQFGTLISWLLFLVALFLPLISLKDIDSPFFGTFVITLPLLVLFCARLLDGLTGGNVSVANAYLADITAEEDRSRNFGKMSISSNLGFIVGPALAAILGASALGETLPVAAALVLSLIATVIIRFRLPESKRCIIGKTPDALAFRKVFGQEHKECYSSEAAAVLKAKEIVKLKNIPFMLTLYFLIFLGFNIFYTAFPIHAATSLQWSITQLGIFLSTLSVMMVVVQGPVLGRLTTKYSDAFLAIVGSVILGTNFILLLSESVAIIYLAAFLFALGNGLMWPTFLSILSKTANEQYQGAVQGLASSAGSCASIIGLITGGFLYDALGVPTFLVSAFIIYVVFLLAFRLLTFEQKGMKIQRPNGGH
jgi:DHA1 family tetracycline resistance protein-like MFS transporter